VKEPYLSDHTMADACAVHPVQTPWNADIPAFPTAQVMLEQSLDANATPALVYCRIIDMRRSGRAMSCRSPDDKGGFNQTRGVGTRNANEIVWVDFPGGGGYIKVTGVPCQENRLSEPHRLCSPHFTNSLQSFIRHPL